MSLYIKLYINEDQLQVFAATRMSNKPQWNTYEISKISNGRGVVIGETRHRYDDGAVILARKVLKIAIREEGKLKCL
jgi:hypothetical protein